MNSNDLESISNILSDILRHMNVVFSKIETVEEENNVVRAIITTERVSYLIGTHGERVDALQHILKNILWKQGIATDAFIIVDIDGYKKTQEDRILGIAEQKAELAKNIGVSQNMPPLQPYLRKLVHTHLKSFSGIITESVGEGVSRRLQISYRNEEL